MKLNQLELLMYLFFMWIRQSMILQIYLVANSDIIRFGLHQHLATWQKLMSFFHPDDWILKWAKKFSPIMIIASNEAQKSKWNNSDAKKFFKKSSQSDLHDLKLTKSVTRISDFLHIRSEQRWILTSLSCFENCVSFLLSYFSVHIPPLYKTPAIAIGFFKLYCI